MAEPYFDELAQIHLDAVVCGRVALVGDAAHGATLGGLGTGLAMVGAYVLAVELAAADGNHITGFANYQREIRAYARGCQKHADGAGPFLAPRTSGQSGAAASSIACCRRDFFDGLTTKAARAYDEKTTLPFGEQCGQFDLFGNHVARRVHCRRAGQL